ncbi:hypothetical protein ABI58_22890 [Salmonella enterica subsp. enterica serovar Salford]|nr:hypothetical protein ABI58_22890 [Salmonella enterica subsp. enterica serovar Salford]
MFHGVVEIMVMENHGMQSVVVLPFGITGIPGYQPEQGLAWLRIVLCLPEKTYSRILALILYLKHYSILVIDLLIILGILM